MPKNCKECKYKLQYDYYCKEKELVERMEKDKTEIISEINNCKKYYSHEISEEEIEYWKKLKQQLESKDNTYRTLSKIIHTIVLICSIVMIGIIITYSIYNKIWTSLFTIIPFLLLIIAMKLALCTTKDMTEQDAYNWIMAIVSFSSLIIAILTIEN